MDFEQNKVIDEGRQGEATVVESAVPAANGKRLYVESYGCQMNFSDSEVVASIMTNEGYITTRNIEEADVVLINTCSIRENAETRVRNRLTEFKKRKSDQPELVVGILGCMAERLKKSLLEEEQLVDLVAGPDAYRDLPNLVEEVGSGQRAVNVLLSREETYADISPVRMDTGGVSAFVTIMRGCDNMCSFCVVPFTRGRERSRDPQTIVQECRDLFEKGYREVTLLGQNVDSYRWNLTSKGEVKEEGKPTTNFAQLMEMVALVSPDLRVRFSTSHPKDMTDDVLEVMAKYENICEYIHLPVQSGNTEVLARMNRGYSREWYLERIEAIRRIVPDCAISTDIITGFCGETDEEHQDTVNLMKEVQYEFAYMFKYSERPKTLAERRFKDDVPEDVKGKRLNEIIDLQLASSLFWHKQQIGKVKKVLVEGKSKRSDEEWCGRDGRNSMVIFPKGAFEKGQYILVKITDCTSATLKGEVVSVCEPAHNY
ncbi:tRNA (N6-isopentenyl adenosine(37)-C2)-methylthiotransferase MiaB [Crocinitomicaceae bacterium CZZ-1]|uniref:tRNA-2-methylthio-N(6)-dimethylallyladenosine synthase n=1 Tax=Taishania pollutisoli TaxID=2766479 RepID=A0A8J6PJH8_9FLAO|nr:tRNA (N6-isopentenyl adenosine(37)-C2)-methylthiotransferase MiaB [Taishania pollutisoli]MBC9812270.1 tRNA (N6-isopentenyl adenosine(37)-C2)-methylthiotransferase MiaB [Taishania pollutisoli]MBX2950249.1 tRNA (N6-isopentenyl adenosine(37)-C2)-methylthiotransferase MiaB [Crocinitomicaceae bacterium]NGF74258.1 tRNA (N6-isopentenyl adenosine(37)-C2)-methylthiotransferase MiaB [Fluviicola sp. SGL-29]